MSFTGNLEHLPIVDVVQLIYTTRKSGTLSIKSPKGESQLVFSDGFFVSANHLNNSVRIGQILIDNNFLSQELLDQALLEQKAAGADRKPLIATLIEQGAINRDDAYKGLEILIEMTIVEVLTWKSGAFSLDVDKTDVCDEYRYFPETLHEEILMNAQNILMDALRIYDEKMRDGTLEKIFFSDTTDENNSNLVYDRSQGITADLLGLDTLDLIPPKIPVTFTGLSDDDSFEEHRRIISEGLADLPKTGQEQLCSFLTRLSSEPPVNSRPLLPGMLSLAIIVFSNDLFIKHAITTICRQKNHIVFTTDDETSLDLMIEQSFSRDLLPILIIDSPEYMGDGCTSDAVSILLLQIRDKFPRISILQMSTCPTDQILLPHALDEGTEAIFPRPVPERGADAFVVRMTGFLQAFGSVLDKSFVQPDRLETRKLRDCIELTGRLSEPPEVARQLLLFTSDLFERAMVLVVGATEVTAEKGIGVTAAKSAGPSGPLMFKIPLVQGSLFRDVIEKRRMFYGLASDVTLRSSLYTVIAEPHNPKILILPLMMSDRVIALVYADFGQGAPSPIHIEHLEILARFAAMTLDNSLYRKKFERLTQVR